MNLRSANHDSQPHPTETKLKHQRQAFVSVILGLVSLIPSLMLIDLAMQQGESSGSAGDFQGGGIIILIAIFAVALLGFPAVFIGITGLRRFLTEKPADRKLLFLSIMGILLGSPILIVLILMIS